MNKNEFEETERKLARLEKLELAEYRKEEQRFGEILDMDEDWDGEDEIWPEDAEEDG